MRTLRGPSHKKDQIGGLLPSLKTAVNYASSENSVAFCCCVIDVTRILLAT